MEINHCGVKVFFNMRGPFSQNFSWYAAPSADPNSMGRHIEALGLHGDLYVIDHSGGGRQRYSMCDCRMELCYDSYEELCAHYKKDMFVIENTLEARCTGAVS